MLTKLQSLKYHTTDREMEYLDGIVGGGYYKFKLDKSEKVKILNVWLDFSLKRRWDGELNDPKELEKVRNHCKRLLISFGDS